MLLNAYAVLLALAFYLNRHDRRMLMLTLAVGASVFLPMPRHSAFLFYLFCMLAELLVALIAIILQARGRELILSLCAALELTHVMGYILDGSSTLSSYRVIVPVLEAAQLVACIALSPAIFARLQNRLP